MMMIFNIYKFFPEPVQMLLQQNPHTQPPVPCLHLASSYHYSHWWSYTIINKVWEGEDVFARKAAVSSQHQLMLKTPFYLDESSPISVCV